MSLSDLASLGSIVSGVAVAVTLILLLMQMRQNTRSVRAQNAIAHFQMVAQRNERMTDPNILGSSEKASVGESGININEFLGFAFTTQTMMTALYTDWLLDRQHLLHRGIHSNNFLFQARHVLARPGLRAFWKTYRSQFTSEFVAEMDRVMAETTPVADSDYGFSVWQSHVADELSAIGVGVGRADGNG